MFDDAKFFCTRCREKPRRAPEQRWCPDCHAEHMRNTRPKHSELAPEQRKKANARSYAHVYRDRGLIERAPCSVCGDKHAEMHHPDHDLPTKVEWLCRRHHLSRHA